MRFDDRMEHYKSSKSEERMLRVEYIAPHVNAGEIWHYEAETHVRTTFQDDHARKSEVQHFEDNQLARRTFLDSRRNLVEHYADGELVRKTYEGGAYKGTTEHFAAGLHTKRTFESGPHIGHVMYFDYTTAQDVPGREIRRGVAHTDDEQRSATYINHYEEWPASRSGSTSTAEASSSSENSRT
jgi:hypothetical protein